MSEVSEVAQVGVQVVRVAFDGAELAFKIGKDITKESIEMIKKMLKLLAFLHTKSIVNTNKRHAILGAGKTNIKYMEPGANFLNIKLDERDRKIAEKLLKQYGVLYTKLPDLNRNDGMCEYLYNAKDVSKVNMVIDRLNEINMPTSKSKSRQNKMTHAEAINQSLEEYLKNTSMEELDKALKQDDPLAFQKMQEKFGDDLTKADQEFERLHEEKAEKKFVEENKVTDKNFMQEESEKKQKSTQKNYSGYDVKGHQDINESTNGYSLAQLEQTYGKKFVFKEDLRRKIRFDDMNKNSAEFLKISLNKELVVEEKENSMKFILPKSKQEKYVWLSKDDLYLGDGGKTFFAYVAKKKLYAIGSISGKEKEKLNGNELYDRYLDPVNREHVKVEPLADVKDKKIDSVAKEKAEIKEKVTSKKQTPRKQR